MDCMLPFRAMTLTIDGKNYTIVSRTHLGRAIINYEGLFVLADYDLNSNQWVLSGEPASEDEKAILNELTAPTRDVTVRRVIEDDSE